MAQWRRRALIATVATVLAAIALSIVLHSGVSLKKRATAAIFRRASPTPGLPQVYTPAALAAFSGTNGVLLVAIDALVYEVSSARARYGPGGSYAAMAGRDITHHLARYTVPAASEEPTDCPLTRTGLSDKQVHALNGWIEFFSAKYPVVGRLVCADGTESVHETENINN